MYTLRGSSSPNNTTFDSGLFGAVVPLGERPSSAFVVTGGASRCTLTCGSRDALRGLVGDRGDEEAEEWPRGGGDSSAPGERGALVQLIGGAGTSILSAGRVRVLLFSGEPARRVASDADEDGDNGARSGRVVGARAMRSVGGESESMSVDSAMAGSSGSEGERCAEKDRLRTASSVCGSIE